jgi:hypothetical protein
VSSKNLRNAPIDRRRLNAEDRAAYNAANPGGGRRGMALERSRARRGAIAYRTNKPRNTTDAKPGSGGVGYGSGIQQQRQRDSSQEKRRNEGFRPEKFKLPEDPQY